MSETITKFGVARGEKLIGDTFEDVEAAKQHLANVEVTAASIGLESDVRIVTVEYTTTVGRPHVYKEPEPEVVETEAPADEQA